MRRDTLKLQAKKNDLTKNWSCSSQLFVFADLEVKNLFQSESVSSDVFRYLCSDVTNASTTWCNNFKFQCRGCISTIHMPISRNKIPTFPSPIVLPRYTSVNWLILSGLLTIHIATNVLKSIEWKKLILVGNFFHYTK